MGDEVIDTFPRRFWDRVCQEKIKAPFTKEMFLQETDIIATIKGFGLDVNKFWWAVLFVYDWSIEKFTKCFWVKLPPKSLTKILDYIGDSKDFEITFRVKGKKSREADPNVKAAVMYGLRQKLKEWKEQGVYRIIDHSTYTTTFTNSSYYMCFAARMTCYCGLTRRLAKVRLLLPTRPAPRFDFLLNKCLNSVLRLDPWWRHSEQHRRLFRLTIINISSSSRPL